MLPPAGPRQRAIEVRGAFFAQLLAWNAPIRPIGNALLYPFTLNGIIQQSFYLRRKKAQ